MGHRGLDQPRGALSLLGAWALFRDKLVFAMRFLTFDADLQVPDVDTSISMSGWVFPRACMCMPSDLPLTVGVGVSENRYRSNSSLRFGPFGKQPRVGCSKCPPIYDLNARPELDPPEIQAEVGGAARSCMFVPRLHPLKPNRLKVRRIASCLVGRDLSILSSLVCHTVLGQFGGSAEGWRADSLAEFSTPSAGIRGAL